MTEYYLAIAKTIECWEGSGEGSPEISYVLEGPCPICKGKYLRRAS